MEIQLSVRVNALCVKDYEAQVISAFLPLFYLSLFFAPANLGCIRIKQRNGKCNLLKFALHFMSLRLKKCCLILIFYYKIFALALHTAIETEREIEFMKQINTFESLFVCARLCCMPKAPLNK